MFNAIGTTEMVFIGIIALMLFGSRLPEMARKFGGTYRDLRRKVDEFQREFRDWDKIDTTAPTTEFRPDDEIEKTAPTTPKFIPPPAEDDE